MRRGTPGRIFMEKHKTESVAMDRYYVYKDWSHVSSNQNDMRSIEKDESMHPAAQRLPTKLNKMLEDPGVFTSSVCPLITFFSIPIIHTVSFLCPTCSVQICLE